MLALLGGVPLDRQRVERALLGVGEHCAVGHRLALSIVRLRRAEVAVLPDIGLRPGVDRPVGKGAICPLVKVHCNLRHDSSLCSDSVPLL